jgi:hypothetical protein
MIKERADHNMIGKERNNNELHEKGFSLTNENKIMLMRSLLIAGSLVSIALAILIMI